MVRFSQRFSTLKFSGMTKREIFLAKDPKENELPAFLGPVGGFGSKAGLRVLGQPAPRPPERKDAARNRRRILDAVQQLLEQKDIEEICMDSVAKAAGVGKGTLYRRFANRAELCHALLHENTAELQDWVLAGCGLGGKATWLHRLEALLTGLMTFVFDNQKLLAEAFRNARGSSYNHPAHLWQRDAVAMYLARSRQEKGLKPIDTALCAEFILVGTQSALVGALLDRGLSREQILAEFIRGALAAAVDPQT